MVSFIDVEKERVAMLIDSLDGISVVSFNMIKKSADKDNELEDIFKSLLANRPPF